MSRPSSSQQHPPGLCFIVGNEAAERFSYYGMKSILVVFMTTALLNAQGQQDVMTERDATFWYHMFTMGNYFLPIVGALLADVFWGKYKTIVLLSAVYCFGHLALALNETRMGLLIGLSLIALGSGGIKPCVSAHLGDQYVSRGSAKMSEGFSLFYLAINLGAFLSTLLIPYLFSLYGPQVAFAVPGVFMAVATFVFWIGRTRYITVPPTPWHSYVAELFHASRRRQLTRLAWLYLMVSFFWALFDQTGSSWVFQAERLERSLSLPLFGSIEVLAAQLQALNPILILVFTPLFVWGLYPWLARREWLTTQVKLISGMLLTSASFLVVALTQHLLEGGAAVSILWQASAYVLLTAAEVLISVTTLEMAYVFAPRVSKSFITSFYLLSVAGGNLFTALSTRYLPGVIGEPSSTSYFLFFSALPLLLAAPMALTVRTIEAHHQR
jgi:POT family proton-dependent oligopeptide transporter